jgi:hypothetical protein
MSYQQEVKATVRTRVLSHAIRVLSHERESTPVVLPGEVCDVASYAAAMLPELPSKFRDDLFAEFSQWNEFWQSRIGSKMPENLKVLYLSGPEPLNDLQVLLDHGVNPHNVWAISSSQGDVSRAVTQLREAQVPLKVYPGSLAEFFQCFNDTFDIVYFDSCGPLPGGKPDTLEPILQVLIHGRLEPLAVLITNFCQVPSEKLERYADVLTSYFMFRYRDLPREIHNAGIDPAESAYEPRQLRRFICRNIDLVYAEFITRFLADLAMFWIPNCRAASTRTLFEEHFAQKRESAEVVRKAIFLPEEEPLIKEFLDQVGDVSLSPSSYPLLSFFLRLKSLMPGDPLVNQLGNTKINGFEMGSTIPFASLADRVFEGHWGCLSKKLKQAIRVSWFDLGNHFSCDAPLPNLLINSLLGVFGCPSFPNPRKSLRFEYVSKTNRMYCDLFVLDRCRYYFDWLPTLDTFEGRFDSIAFQVLARCILDRIGRHRWYCDVHPFHGSTVADSSSSESARFYDFASREDLSANRSAK